jgi:hypothetical protein
MLNGWKLLALAGINAIAKANCPPFLLHLEPGVRRIPRLDDVR